MSEVMGELRDECASAQREVGREHERAQELGLTLGGVTEELKSMAGQPGQTDPYALLAAVRQQLGAQAEVVHSLKQRQAQMLLGQEQTQKEQERTYDGLRE